MTGASEGWSESIEGWSESMALQAAIGAIWANPQREGLDAELFSEHVNPGISESAYKHGSSEPNAGLPIQK